MFTIHEESHVRVRYEPRLRLLEVEWLDNTTTSTEFRQTYHQLLLLAERYQVRAWLTDVRHLPPLLPADLIWLEQHWFPRYVQLKLEKVAVVQALSGATRRSIAASATRADEAGYTNRPEPRYFTDPDEARAWMREPFIVGQLPSWG